MYTVSKVHKLHRDGNLGMLLSGFAVIDESGNIVKDGKDYLVFKRKSAATKTADHLNSKKG